MRQGWTANGKPFSLMTAPATTGTSGFWMGKSRPFGTVATACNCRPAEFLTLLNPTRPGVPVKSLKAKLLDATDGARAAAVVTEGSLRLKIVLNSFLAGRACL